MAETKTTTLAQIKMGTEKLTRTKTKDNTDIAAYKLPDFEKGSLILAKDTGNIYIDAPDETSRIHVGVGIATVNRGETFNNHYKFNLALSDSTHAEGYKTQAGYNYFEVKAIDVANKKITLGDATGLTTGMAYELFDFNTLVDITRKITTGTISAISDKVITVDNLPENTDSDKLANLRFTIPVSWGVVTDSKPALQHVFGNLQTGAGDQSHSEGIWNRALGFTSHTSGGYNTVYGNYSAIIGANSCRVYGNRSLATGGANVSYGYDSFLCGQRNISKGNMNFVGGLKNTSDYAYQSVLGLCNSNKESTLLEIGNGTYETVTDENGKSTINVTSRKNAFEVYLDGHAELQNQGTTDNSVVIRKYLNDTIASQVSSVYKAKGSIANISALATPSKSYEGFVYNIETEFTTTANFVEGAGKKFPAGTNVVCVNTTGTTYKWDVLAGMVDLTNYATKTDLSGKQATLVSGTNIKTINGQSLLGSGNITIEGGGGTAVTVDDDLSSESTNPVQNKVINAALNKKQNNVGLTKNTDNSILTVDSTTVSLPKGSGVIENATFVFGSSQGDYGIQLAQNRLILRNYLGDEKLSLLGVRTPVSAADTSLGITTDDLPYQATNKTYVDTETAKKQDKLTSSSVITVKSINATNYIVSNSIYSESGVIQFGDYGGTSEPISLRGIRDGEDTSDAVNKGQLDTAVANKQDTFSTVTTTTDETTLTADKPINITTNKYSMVYDDANEAIKITFA